MIFFRTAADATLKRQGMQQRLQAASGDGPNYLTSMYDFFEIARSVGARAAGRLFEICPEERGPPPADWPIELGVSYRGEYRRWLDKRRGAMDASPPPSLLSQLPNLVGRRPLRLAIINGFGTGIGDCLVGLSAWRLVREEISRAGLLDLDVEMWVRPRGFPNNREVCALDRTVDRVELLPMPLERFAGRDAFFDLSGLLDRPGVDTTPFVDFLLGLMGMDSGSVPATRKRNRIDIPEDIDQQVEDAIRGHAERYVLLHPLSSNVLRDMPVETFTELTHRIVEETDCHVATVVQGPKVHPRQVDLSDISWRGYPWFCSIVRQAAGMVTVDTSAYHIADAFNVPSVVIFSTILPRLRVAYYPCVEGILLPGMERSRLMGRHTVNDPAEAASLGEHWRSLDVSDVVHKLARLMQKRCESAGGAASSSGPTAR